MYFSRPFHSGRDFLINSHAGTDHLVSVLDLDNVIVGPNPEGLSLLTHTRVQPTTLIISLNDVNASEEAASDWTIKRKSFRLIKSDRSVMVEPNGFEPMTSCLQSRRSTN
jgi:hypothetical protein